MTPTPLKTRVLSLAACAALAAGLSACENDNVAKNADLIAGKKAFAQKCGSCHVLARAGTKGVHGPEPRRGLSPVAEGRLRARHDPRRRGRPDPPSGQGAEGQPGLHAGRARHRQARQRRRVLRRQRRVAAGQGRRQARRPRSAAAGAGKPVAAKDGKLALPADPNGQLAYITKVATAPAGALEIDSKNDAAIPHDIAIEGNGVNEKGETVQDGGVSKVSATLEARQVPVLLHGRRPPRGRHGRHAHRQVVARLPLRLRPCGRPAGSRGARRLEDRLERHREQRDDDAHRQDAQQQREGGLLGLPRGGRTTPGL